MQLNHDYRKILKAGKSIARRLQALERPNSLHLWFVLPLSFLIIFFLALISSCNASTITDVQAIKAIIGEAENQGFKGQLMIASAIRNRRTLKGVYGLHNPRVVNHLYSQAIYDQCVLAWAESRKKDYAFGATHWENTKAFGRPYWVKSMKLVYQYKDHNFYKEK